ncbi:hypothetical protein KEM52_001636 [Ascosphaera acerosa]|nr:hypothetical protein KEM52_001636 [Ascosphaera acerosa]
MPSLFDGVAGISSPHARKKSRESYKQSRQSPIQEASPDFVAVKQPGRHTAHSPCFSERQLPPTPDEVSLNSVVNDESQHTNGDHDIKAPLQVIGQVLGPSPEPASSSSSNKSVRTDGSREPPSTTPSTMSDDLDGFDTAFYTSFAYPDSDIPAVPALEGKCCLSMSPNHANARPPATIGLSPPPMRNCADSPTIPDFQPFESIMPTLKHALECYSPTRMRHSPSPVFAGPTPLSSYRRHGGKSPRPAPQHRRKTTIDTSGWESIRTQEDISIEIEPLRPKPLRQESVDIVTKKLSPGQELYTKWFDDESDDEEIAEVMGRIMPQHQAARVVGGRSCHDKPFPPLPALPTSDDRPLALPAMPGSAATLQSSSSTPHTIHNVPSPYPRNLTASPFCHSPTDADDTAGLPPRLTPNLGSRGGKEGEASDDESELMDRPNTSFLEPDGIESEHEEAQGEEPAAQTASKECNEQLAFADLPLPPPPTMPPRPPSRTKQIMGWKASRLTQKVLRISSAPAGSECGAAGGADDSKRQGSRNMTWTGNNGEKRLFSRMFKRFSARGDGTASQNGRRQKVDRQSPLATNAVRELAEAECEGGVSSVREPKEAKPERGKGTRASLGLIKTREPPRVETESCSERPSSSDVLEEFQQKLHARFPNLKSTVTTQEPSVRAPPIEIPVIQRPSTGASSASARGIMSSIPRDSSATWSLGIKPPPQTPLPDPPTVSPASFNYPVELPATRFRPKDARRFSKLDRQGLPPPIVIPPKVKHPAIATRDGSNALSPAIRISEHRDEEARSLRPVAEDSPCTPPVVTEDVPGRCITPTSQIRQSQLLSVKTPQMGHKRTMSRNQRLAELANVRVNRSPDRQSPGRGPLTSDSSSTLRKTSSVQSKSSSVVGTPIKKPSRRDVGAGAVPIAGAGAGAGAATRGSKRRKRIAAAGNVSTSEEDCSMMSMASTYTEFPSLPSPRTIIKGTPHLAASSPTQDTSPSACSSSRTASTVKPRAGQLASSPLRATQADARPSLDASRSVSGSQPESASTARPPRFYQRN